MGEAACGQASVVEAATLVASPPDAVDFRRLFLLHESYVLRTLRRLGVPDRDVEDMAHEVFLRVYKKREDMDANRPAKPWLFAFCFRVASNYRRMARRSSPIEADGSPDLADPAAEGPGELIDRERKRRLVLLALDELTLDRRAVFVMHVLDLIAIPEVALALGIPLGTAYTRLRAAKKDFVEVVRRLSDSRGAQ